MDIEEMNLENEIDTGELELLEFLVGDEHFGINIAKVSEIIIHCDVTHVPSAPKAVEGVFMHRDGLVTVIDLHEVLDIPRPDTDDTLLIVCDFNQLSVAFDVTNVIGIQQIKWSQVEKPPSTTNNGIDSNLATGIAKVGNKIMMILDFEKIVCDTNAGKEFEVGEVESANAPAPSEFNYDRRVLVVEDSLFLSKVMCNALKKVGFTNVSPCYNGREAWDSIEKLRGTNLIQNLACVITDIEMPQMDGHSLVRMIREDNDFSKTPIVVFSSLIHDNIRQKGEAIGANAQFSRAQLNECVNEVIDLIAEYK